MHTTEDGMLNECYDLKVDTPLMEACYHSGNVEVVKLLLAASETHITIASAGSLACRQACLKQRSTEVW